MQRRDEFVRTMERLGRGKTMDRLHDELGKVGRAVVETGKEGKLVLELKIKPNGEEGICVVPGVKVTIPQPDEATTFLYFTPDGRLANSDPAQMMLPGTATGVRVGAGGLEE